MLTHLPLFSLQSSRVHVYLISQIHKTFLIFIHLLHFCKPYFGYTFLETEERDETCIIFLDVLNMVLSRGLMRFPGFVL